MVAVGGKLFTHVRLVIGRRHQGVQVGRIIDFNFDDPAFIVWIFVQQARFAAMSIVEGRIEFQHLAGDGHKQIGSGFYRFHGSEDGMSIDGFAHRFYFDINEFAQFALGKIGDADVGGVAVFEANPFMVFGVFCSWPEKSWCAVENY